MIAAPPLLSSCTPATLAPMADAPHAPDEILRPAEPPLVFCPLGFERRAFLRFGKLPVVTTGPGVDAIRRAFAERDRWPVRAPRMVILLGLAGAIDDRWRSGEAATIAAVHSADGSTCLASSVPGGEATIVEVDRVIVDPAEKRRLAERSHAELVDTESRAFAEAADAAGIPWAIVRGVSDDARTALPPEIAGFVGSDGETRTGRVLAALLARPTLLRDLLRLARTSRRAMRHASFAADALGCLEGITLCAPERPLLLFGGSFDPPHRRHASVLSAAMRALHAPAAVVMPAAINPLKAATPPADPEARLAMCRAAFTAADADFPAEVRLSRLEIDRTGPSYTIDTVETLLRRHANLASAVRFLVGSDAIRGIERWHRWRELLACATPAVVVRPPDTRAAVAEFLRGFADRSGFADAPDWLLDIPPVELSSTDLRTAIARGERPDGISDGVWREITARGLYGFGGGR